ncbi:MAG: TlyA family RNA methyltransferase [Lachnospiraceae bacterium]|nr:TlyA family RNA methyltransferase [Lachnospiraceae bacterium]
MTRLDVFLVENGYFDSREKAKTEILCGNVLVNERRLKASDKVKNDCSIRIIQQMPFVSRGGYKLDKAVKVFSLNLQNKVMLDIGASTGGFTDVMLKNGARKVFAVDVGYGQLHYKLRNDNRVVSMERCNARNLSFDMFDERPDVATMDVSFISVLLIIPALKNILKDDGKLVALIKPQFEAGKEQVGKNGVVRDKEVHHSVIHKVINGARENGFYCKGLDFSPIKGPEGNIEFISLFDFVDESVDIDIAAVVNKAHENKF